MRVLSEQDHERLRRIVYRLEHMPERQTYRRRAIRRGGGGVEIALFKVISKDTTRGILRCHKIDKNFSENFEIEYEISPHPGGASNLESYIIGNFLWAIQYYDYAGIKYWNALSFTNVDFYMLSEE